MVLFPNGKINLGLHVIQKRPDGFHDLETVFYPVAIKDALELITAGSNVQHPETVTSMGGIDFSSSGLPVSGVLSDHLCIKAFLLLKKDFPDLPRLQLHLLKAIPMGAGLGGGSADGAFTLKLINQVCGLNLSESALEAYAFLLGSDCPFFIKNKPCLATSRGEKMQEINLNLSGYSILVVNPGIHISTAAAFTSARPCA